LEVFLGIITIIAGIALIWAIFSLLWEMAEARGQPPVLWVLLFFVIGFFAHLALWLFFDIEDEEQSCNQDGDE